MSLPDNVPIPSEPILQVYSGNVLTLTETLLQVYTGNIIKTTNNNRS